jgi:hypothetical protein
MSKSSGPSSQDAEDAAAQPARRSSSDTRRQAARARHRRALDKKYTPEERARVAEAAGPVDREVFKALIRGLVKTPPGKKR